MIVDPHANFVGSLKTIAAENVWERVEKYANFYLGYRRLHLPVNARALWLSSVKLWSFPTEMWSFSSRHCSKVRRFQSTRKEEIIRKASHFQAIWAIKWKNLRRIILFQKFGEDYAAARVQFQKSLSSTTWLEARLPKGWITFEQFLSVLSETIFKRSLLRPSGFSANEIVFRLILCARCRHKTIAN